MLWSLATTFPAPLTHHSTSPTLSHLKAASLSDTQPLVRAMRRRGRCRRGAGAQDLVRARVPRERGDGRARQQHRRARRVRLRQRRRRPDAHHAWPRPASTLLGRLGSDSMQCTGYSTARPSPCFFHSAKPWASRCAGRHGHLRVCAIMLWQGPRTWCLVNRGIIVVGHSFAQNCRLREEQALPVARPLLSSQARAPSAAAVTALRPLGDQSAQHAASSWPTSRSTCRSRRRHLQSVTKGLLQIDNPSRMIRGTPRQGTQAPRAHRHPAAAQAQPAQKPPLALMARSPEAHCTPHSFCCPRVHATLARRRGCTPLAQGAAR